MLINALRGCGMAVVCLLVVAISATAQDRRVMVMPTMPAATGGFIDACLSPAQWPTGWERAELFGNAIQHINAASDSDLAQCFANLQNSNKKLVVELAAVKEHCTTGQECWNEQVGILSRFVSLGASLDYFALDEPLTMVLKRPEWTQTGLPRDYNYAVVETAEFVRLARQQFPGLEIIAAEAYPTLDSSTLQSFFADLNSAVAARTGWGIQYAAVDHDWNDPLGSTGDVIQIQNSVRGAGVSFAAVYWNADPNLSWYNGLMEQADRYRSARRGGLDPDLYAVWNWTGGPSDTLPESSSSSFTNSVRDFLNTYVPEPTSDFGLDSNESLTPGEYRNSVDGRFTLTYQYDGNLVLYYGSNALWSSGTDGTLAGQVEMQGDGNLVVYDGNGVPVWSSGTYNRPGAYLIVQSDGNLVIYDGVWFQWASNTDWY